MLVAVVCVPLILYASEPDSPEFELQIKLERITWANRKQPPDAEFVAKAKAVASMTIVAHPGKPFQVETVVRRRRLFFAGTVSVNSSNKVDAALRMGYGKISGLGVREAQSRLVFPLSKRQFFCGSSGQNTTKRGKRFSGDGFLVTVTRHPTTRKLLK